MSILLCLMFLIPAFGLEAAHTLNSKMSAGTIQYLGEAQVSNVIANVPTPTALVFSPARGAILVSSSSNQMIYVLQPGTYKDVLNFSLGETPIALDWDSVDANVFTTTSQGNMLSLDGDTLATVGNASVPSPGGMFYDSVKNRIYATSLSSNTVYVIAASSTTVLKMISVCCSPGSLVYDSENGYLYVTESVSNTVAVINPETGSIVANISVGSDPQSIVNVGHYVYVANYNSNSISVLDASTNTLSETISNVGANPDAIAYNSYNGCLYVANYGGSSVSEVCSGSLNSTIAVGAEPDALIYDPVSYSILVANYGSGTISEILTPGAPSLPTRSSTTSIQNTATSDTQSVSSTSTNVSIAAFSSTTNESSSSVSESTSTMPVAQTNYIALIVVLLALLPETGALVYFKRRGL